MSKRRQCSKIPASPAISIGKKPGDRHLDLPPLLPWSKLDKLATPGADQDLDFFTTQELLVLLLAI